MYQAFTQEAKGDKKMIAFVYNEFFSHAHKFEEAQAKKMDSYNDTQDIYLEKVRKFEDSRENWSEEDSRQIHLLELMMEIYLKMLKENMDGSKEE